MEKIYLAYLRVMSRVAKKLRPNKFNKWEKTLALYVPINLRSAHKIIRFDKINRRKKI